MRFSGLVFASLTASLVATTAFAQMSGGGANSGSMSGGNAGGGLQMNAQGGVSIFSHENMAMMIVERERSTKGMTPDQAQAARQEEMTKDRAETPDQRQARKARYDSEWLQLTAAEKSDALAKLDAQTKARAAAQAQQPAK